MLKKEFAGTTVNRDNNLRAAISLTYDVPFIPGLEATASLNMEAQNEWNKNIVKQFMMYTYDPSYGEGRFFFYYLLVHTEEITSVLMQTEIWSFYLDLH